MQLKSNVWLLFLIWQCIPQKKNPVLSERKMKTDIYTLAWLFAASGWFDLWKPVTTQRHSLLSQEELHVRLQSIFSSYVRCLVKHKQGFIGSYEPISKGQKMKWTESEEEKCRVNIVVTRDCCQIKQAHILRNLRSSGAASFPPSLTESG